MTPRSDAIDAALPPLLRSAARLVRALVRGLPVQPPSFVAARALDRLLWPRLDEGQRRLLTGHTVEIELLEPGLRLRLRVGERGFEVAPRGPAAVSVRARTAALLRLARGIDDADRLFFERELVIEGDTELGLAIKNTLDAVGPLWSAAAR